MWIWRQTGSSQRSTGGNENVSRVKAETLVVGETKQSFRFWKHLHHINDLNTHLTVMGTMEGFLKRR